MTIGSSDLSGPVPVIWGIDVSSPQDTMVSTAEQSYFRSRLCMEILIYSAVSGFLSAYRIPFFTDAFLIIDTASPIAFSVAFWTFFINRISWGLFFARIDRIVPLSTRIVQYSLREFARAS